MRGGKRRGGKGRRGGGEEVFRAGKVTDSAAEISIGGERL